MKLNKDICKRCVTKFIETCPSAHPWRDKDEKAWQAGCVWCILSKQTWEKVIRFCYFTKHDSSQELMAVDVSNPPEGCPYAAEHIVLDSEEALSEEKRKSSDETERREAPEPAQG